MYIVSLVGPTAVGKSAMALEIARQLVARGLAQGVDVISADSRQVYRGLSILSGADLPGEAVPHVDQQFGDYPFFQLGNQSMRLHGLAVIEPTQDWSVAHFHRLAHAVIASALAHHHAVIVVGGTGLYQTQLLSPELIEGSPPQDEVRKKAATLNVQELQAWLQQLDQLAYASLNQSDRANPRRLVRAIERTLWQQSQAGGSTEPTGQQLRNLQDSPLLSPSQLSDVHHHFFGLTTTKEDLIARIRDRVAQRLAAGAVNEVLALEASLAEAGVAWKNVPAASACGFREVLAYAHGDLDQEQCLELWTRREVAYAKRQATWWQKYPQVAWHSLRDEGWQEQLMRDVLSHFAA